MPFEPGCNRPNRGIAFHARCVVRGPTATAREVVVLGALFCLHFVGCGDSSDDGATASSGTGSCSAELDSNGCFDAECFELPARDVSFSADILPIFENSCALSSACHGNPSSPNTSAGYQPYLGEVDPATTPSDVDAILALIVGQPSRAAPGLAIVEPGAPEQSFLMHKMDDSLSCSSVECPDGCGDVMPKGSGPLERETRDLVRGWIAQGAASN
jgi:hypothetical protein